MNPSFSSILLYQCGKVGICTIGKVVVPIVESVVDGERGCARCARRLGLGIGESKTVDPIRVQRLGRAACGGEGTASAAFARDLPVCSVGMRSCPQNLHRCPAIDLRLRPNTTSRLVSRFQSTKLSHRGPT